MPLTQTFLSDIHTLQNTLIQHHKSYGYQWVDTPYIDDAELFLARAGDKIIEKMFVFERYGKTLSLRPEFTTTAMSHYIRDHHKTHVRWQFFGTTFEDKLQHFSPSYQQLSAGVELIGLSGIQADAEVIQLAVTGVQKLGLSGHRLVLGNVGLQSHLMSQFGLDTFAIRLIMNQRDKILFNQKRSILDQFSNSSEFGENNSLVNDEQATTQLLNVLLDSTQYGTTMGGRTRQDISARLTHKRTHNIGLSQVNDALDFLENWMKQSVPVSEFDKLNQFIKPNDSVGQQLLSDWHNMVDMLLAYNISEDIITIQPDLTQNWDYYTGMVFHITHDNTIIVSGGRYDELGYLIGRSQQIPAVGFAYYIDHLVADLSSSPLRIISINNNPSIDVLDVADYLRQHGFSVVLNDKKAHIQLEILEDGIIRVNNQKQYTTNDTDQLITDLKVLLS